MQDKVDQSVGHQWKSLSIQWLEGKGGGGGGGGVMGPSRQLGGS